MPRSLYAVFFVALLAAMPISGSAETDNNRFVVFIHAGGGSQEAAQQVALALGKEGFVVRRPDNQRDTVGGPGIDYFNQQDAGGAARAASIVNAAMPRGSRNLPTRLQRAKNPPGYLGVWLF